jgi:glutamyl-tRNA reductase
MPRDVAPGVAGLAGVHVIDLALLQGEGSRALLQGEGSRALLQGEGSRALLQGEGSRALLQGEGASTAGGPAAGPVAADDIAAAHVLIETETGLFRVERQAAEVAPTVSALRSQAADVVDAELLRLSTRLPDLDARARGEIARTVHRVVDKLLHEPTVRVKELAASPGATDYAGALRALFGLGIDAEVDGEAAVLADAVTVDPERPGGPQ